MDGPSVTLTPEQATPDNAVAACAEVCRTARRPGPDGYPFMGLQWNNMCFCGDTYDKADGTGRLDVSECDSNGDMVPDCGQSMVGTDPNPNACVWRNGTVAILSRFVVLGLLRLRLANLETITILQPSST